MNGAAPSDVEVAIVADDLTGAADCAAAFAEAGRRPIVMLEAGTGTEEAHCGRDVIAVSANSRDIDADGAADAVAAAVRALAVSAPRIWFKKIDSTLRGHLAAELRVVADLVSPELTIVCPAFPRTGRVLREGRVFVHGEPLEQTGLWRDAGGREAHLPTMLAAGGAVTVVPVTVAEVRSGKFASILSAAARGRVLVVDAETDEDLDALIAIGIACGRRVLWVGSAGLSGALAAALAPAATPEAGIGATADAVPDAGPVLVVAGSASEQTQRQLADLEQSCDATVALLPVEGLLDRDSAARRVTLEVVGAALDARLDAALAIEPAASGARLPRHGTELTDRLGELVGELAGRFDGLVLTGGDTARAVLQALGVGALAVVGNVEFGIPASRASLSNLRLVTKAGAFGDDHSLSRAVRALHSWPAEFTTETRGR